MSISAMKQALQALDLIDKDIAWQYKSPTRKFCNQAAHFLRQAIEQAEKTVPSDYSNSHQREWVSLTDEEFEEILKELSHDPRLLAVEIEARLTEKNI